MSDDTSKKGMQDRTRINTSEDRMPRTKIGPTQPDRKALDIEIARLRELGVGALRARWHTVFGRRSPPHLPRHLLFRIMAYRLLITRKLPRRQGSKPQARPRRPIGTVLGASGMGRCSGRGVFARRREISAFRGLPGGPGGVPLFQLFKSLGCPTSLSDASAAKGQFSEFPNLLPGAPGREAISGADLCRRP
jgi:hypothetical protein